MVQQCDFFSDVPSAREIQRFKKCREDEYLCEAAGLEQGGADVIQRSQIIA